MPDYNKKNYYNIMMIMTTVFFAILHFTFVGFTNDDSYFVVLRSEWSSLYGLIVDRYLTDSSRVLSETVLFFLIDKPFIMWQILDVIMCIILTHSLYVILINDKHSKLNIILFMGVASYPFMHVGSAGWICTTLNFLWPLAMLSYGMSGIARRYRNEEIRPVKYILYILALIFGANCEQSTAVILMLSGMALVYAIMDKRGKWFEITSLAIGLLGMVFALTAPGNGARTEMEAANWMPEFFDLTIFDKFRLCAVFVFEHFVMIPDVIFFLFAILVLFVGMKKVDSKLKKAVAFVPIVTDVIFTAIYFVRDFILGHKTNYDFTTPSIFVTDTTTAVVQYSELLGLFLFIGASVLTIIWSYKDGKKAFTLIWILGAGFAVRMALMLSPTMFASWHRTLIYMYFAFIAVSVVFIKDLFYEETMVSMNKSAKIQKGIIIAILAMGIVFNLILTVGLQIRKGMM